MTTHKILRTNRLSAAALTIFAGLALSLAGCKSNGQAIPTTANSGDPAAANLAEGPQTAANGQPTQVMGTSQSYAPQQQSQEYPQQQAAPIEQNYPDQQYSD
ncbi:MAG TPA: hypothetical protein VFC39_13785, partial [Acidobacteriaceae bacterium]|nr:hypothetical protein [Acidobacteriaceae bacterium]